MTTRPARRILSFAVALPAALIVKGFVLMRPDPNARVAFARRFRPRIGINQIDREIKRLCAIVARHRPETVLGDRNCRRRNTLSFQCGSG
jgi:hypothetical protein